jgi:hypothetical protein
MKKLILALSALSLLGAATPSIAANPCRDKSGKFIKCPPKISVKPKACRDDKGHFMKCK